MRKRPPPALLLAIAGTLAAAIAVVAILVGTSGSSSSRTSTAGAASGFDGAALPPGVKAENFTLTDQNGRRVSLSDYRGQVVVVAFLYSTCGETCIVIAQQIRGALDDLDDLDERHSHPPAVLIVSADPATDTRAHVARFLSEVSLSGRVRFLTGAPSQLRQLWRSYDVTPASAGAAAFDRVASVLLIDARGNKRVLFESEQLTPESLSHDIGLLDGASTHP